MSAAHKTSVWIMVAQQVAEVKLDPWLGFVTACVTTDMAREVQGWWCGSGSTEQTSMQQHISCDCTPGDRTGRVAAVPGPARRACWWRPGR